MTLNITTNPGAPSSRAKRAKVGDRAKLDVFAFVFAFLVVIPRNARNLLSSLTTTNLEEATHAH